MNPENEEQKAVPQTLCGALQKEANCKCLVLSVLIYGCLAAVTWCRCANVTKNVINFSTFPIKSTKHVSPCDDGYIYIPVAFMGMLYLVYLVECYHSPIRIDLLHAESQSSALAKLTQLRLAQPTIWWKAISYHYVRRKRQVMRYRNGDNFTTTQVYYERVNSHAATSFYFYDYCGSKDISKELGLDPKIAITKISLSKGFAFSNVRSATEFEEARSRFFAEQEFRDDYMEMREGLDLGCNFSPITLVAVLGNPWFTRSYVYWCLSALLLSWPLRIIIECNTQYVDYQITKLFGVNYDTPSNIQIHTSASQLSAPGSYMLAPSYSEALLMEPAGPLASAAREPNNSAALAAASDLVPSYSEALLYERAAAELQPSTAAPAAGVPACTERYSLYPRPSAAFGCECPCHGLLEHPPHSQSASQESLPARLPPAQPTPSSLPQQQQLLEEEVGRSQNSELVEEEAAAASSSTGCAAGLGPEARICDGCLSTDAVERRGLGGRRELQPRRCCIGRDYSEPDLRRSSEMPAAEAALGFLRANGRSLENIMENEEAGKSNCPEPPAPSRYGQASDGPRGLEVGAAAATDTPTSARPAAEQAQPGRSYTGAIPKRSSSEASNLLVSSAGSNSRLTVNPIAEAVKRLPSSRSTYFCLKSILKQNRRRFTLVTPEELQSLTRTGEPGPASAGPEADSGDDCACQGCRAELARPTSLRIDKRHRPLSCHSLNYRRENSRTLIFASPIQEVCPLDPFAGQNRVTSEQPARYDEATATAATTASTSTSTPVLTRLRRSLTDRADGACASAAKTSRAWRHRRTRSTEPELAQLGTLGSSDAAWTGLNGGSGSNEVAITLPSYDGLTVPPDSRAAQEQSDEERRAFLGDDELAAAASAAASTSQAEASGNSEVRAGSRLRRSLTERRSAPESRRQDRNVRKSFTERIDTGVRIKRANINIETSL